MVYLITNSPLAYGSMRLKEEAKKVNMDLTILSSGEIVSLDIDTIESSKSIFLQRNTGINYNDSDLDILESHSLVVINKPSFHRLLRDKYRQYKYFCEKLEIPMVKTSLISNLSLLQNSRYEKFVLKTLRGNGGRGVEINLSMENLLHKIDQKLALKDLDYLYQPMEIFCTEYKYLYIFGHEYLTRKIFSLGKGNMNEGSQLEIVKDYPEEIIEMISKISNQLKPSIYSCDIGELKEGGFKLIEVNSCPGFEQIDKLLNINCAHLILNCLKDHINNDYK